jgi:hypothetical protein
VLFVLVALLALVIFEDAAYNSVIKLDWKDTNPTANTFAIKKTITAATFDSMLT